MQTAEVLETDGGFDPWSASPAREALSNQNNSFNEKDQLIHFNIVNMPHQRAKNHKINMTLDLDKSHSNDDSEHSGTDSFKNFEIVNVGRNHDQQIKRLSKQIST